MDSNQDSRRGRRNGNRERAQSGVPSDVDQLNWRFKSNLAVSDSVEGGSNKADRQANAVPVQGRGRGQGQDRRNRGKSRSRDVKSVGRNPPTGLTNDEESEDSDVQDKNSPEKPGKSFIGNDRSRKILTAPKPQGGLSGVIKNVVDFGCFIKPSCQLPVGFPEKGDVLLHKSRLSMGLPLKVGDEVTFVLGTKQKEKPLALAVKVSSYRERSDDEILVFVVEQINSLENPGVALGLSNCPALWELFGKVQLSENATSAVVVLHKTLLKLPEYRDSMKDCSVMLFSSKFGTRDGSLAIFLHEVFSNRFDSRLSLVQEYLQLLIRYNSDLVSKIVHVMEKAVMSLDQEPMVKWTFQMLKDSAKHVAKELDSGVFEWNFMPLIPNTDEILSDKAFSVKLMNGVRKDSGYKDSYEYMETYFKLLRTDCFLPISKGIQAFLKGYLDLRDMNVFTNVKLVAFYLDQADGTLVLILTVRPIDSKKKGWENSSNLMFGNLLCISPSGRFDDPLWATVGDKSVGVDGELEIAVQPIQELSGPNFRSIIKSLMTNGESSVLVESPSYYVAVAPVLRTLQSDHFEKVPFEDEIVFTKFKEVMPAYLCGKEAAFELDEQKYDGEIKFGKYVLDSSQSDALIHAFSNQVTLIQGPPGTGKTFIGGIILQKILEDCPPKEPILVLTYKNHALDEFLKHMIKVVGIENVVRVGGRCQDAELEECNLASLRKERKDVDLWNMVKEILDEQTKISEEIMKCIGEIDHSAAGDFSQFRGLFNQYEFDQFLVGAPWSQLLPKNKAAIAIRVVKDFVDHGGRSDEIPALFLQAMKWWAPSTSDVSKYQKQFSRHVTAAVEKIAPKKGKGRASSQPEESNEKDEEEAEKEEGDRLRLAGKNKIKKEKIIKLSHRHRGFGLHTYNWLCLSNASSLCLYDLWNLTMEERIKIIGAMIDALVETKLLELEKLCQSNQELATKKKQLDRHHQARLVSKKKVIAMTVTGASIHQDLLQHLKPSIVLVEEAAEIPEPHLIAALGPWTQHLIMIGDHKQLRPSVESFELVKHCNFDVSMFERLILRGIPKVSLLKQSRMQPEMARLLLDIYPGLQTNFEIVSKNKVPECLMRGVYFWDHDGPETKERSVCNIGEAERVIGLLAFLLHQGIDPARITLLAMYLGQVRLLRKMVRAEMLGGLNMFLSVKKSEEADSTNSKELPVIVSTVDNYQGDENDIVIVSIVRSNPAAVLGFVNTLNRRCVAQSRAKCALIFVGNVSNLRTSPKWSPLLQKLDQQAIISKTLDVKCRFHASTTLNATTGDQLRNALFCTVTCLRVMACNVHHCSKPCQPGHDHFLCKVQVSFIHENCGHSGQKLCYEDPLKVRCTQPITHVFRSCRHSCTIACFKISGTLSCQVDVDYRFPTCSHVLSVKCHVDKSALRCFVKIHHTFPGCGHAKEKVCFEDWTNRKCRTPCTRKLVPCGHPCDRACGDACDPKACFTCSEIRKEEEKAKLKVEAEARRKLQEEAKGELKRVKEQMKTNPLGIFSRRSLDRKGPEAAEFLSIEDRVTKYVQPEHNWYPRVTKIEKITNLSLKAKWLEAKSKMIKPDYSDLKFHGTNKEAVDAIIETGFLLPKKVGMYGIGIYFATDSSKSAQEIYTKGSNTLLLCDVLLGRSKTVEKATSNMNGRRLNSEGFDSLFAPRGSRTEGGVLFDEFVVFDPDQALPVYVVHYERAGYKAPSLSLVTRGNGFERKVLTENRAVDPTDPLQLLYRIAESQFYRLMAARGAHRGQVKSLSKVEYIINPKTEDAYERKKLTLMRKYGMGSNETQEVLVFHGTRTEQNIDSIALNNFELDKAKHCAYGHGIYFSEDPSVSFDYMSGTNKLLLCYLLPGKVGPRGTVVAEGYDSIGANPDQKGRYQILVIDKMDQVRPAFILHLTDLGNQ